MKTNDKVQITKLGILNGQTGTIKAIRYEVDLGPQGVHYCSDGEILPEKKDNSAQAIKIATKPKPDTIVNDVVAIIEKSVDKIEKVTGKRVKVVKELKTKRAYNRKK